MKNTMVKKNRLKRVLVIVAVVAVLASVFMVSASAAEGEINTVADFFSRISGPLSEIYLGIASIISLLAAVGFGICSLGMVIGKNQKTVEEFKAWRTRILITWVVFFMLGVILKLGQTITNGMDFKTYFISGN